jgi:hypothetical protein
MIQSVIKSRKSRNIKSSLRKGVGMGFVAFQRRPLFAGGYRARIAATPMAKPATTTPPILKSSRGDAPELDGAVGTEEDVSVALPEPLLTVLVEDDLIIEEVWLEVVVRRELHCLKNHRKRCLIKILTRLCWDRRW